jgi:hypothetical protein
MKRFVKPCGPKITPFIFTLSTEEREGIPSGFIQYRLSGSSGLSGLSGSSGSFSICGSDG